MKKLGFFWYVSKYIQIRGTEPRLSNLTIDGINVPSPEGGVRQIKLDTIPADIVESVEINKTLPANAVTVERFHNSVLRSGDDPVQQLDPACND